MKESDVEIIPNRRQIDNKFPVLGFTVKTGGLPFYEVIVTTEKQFFAPDRAASRSAANFFSSRQVSNQLQRADAGDSVYIVPASALNSFAQNSPKPSAIYYTLIAYADEIGGGAKFAQPPETLTNSAPSVEVAPSFTGQTLSKVLGIDCDSLRRVESFAASSDFAPQNYQPHDYFGGLSANEPDEGEGEDGFSLMNSQGYSPAFESNQEDETYAEDGYEFNQQQTQTAQSYNGDAYSSNGNYALSEREENNERNYGNDYEDGFEKELGAVPENYSRMQESVFPEGASEPDSLYDEESEYDVEDKSSSDWEDDYAAPQSASNSDDSRFEYAGVPAGYSSNGTKYQADGYSRPAYYDEDDFAAAQANEFEGDYGESYGASLGGESFITKAILGIGGAIKWIVVEAVEFLKKVAARKTVIETVAKFESGGGKNPYKAINADQEFAAWKWHEGFGKYHIGLSYGIVQFTQDGGSLGKLLVMMRDRDKTKFDTTFGGAKPADELIKVTTAKGAFSKDVTGGRSARVQPVDGADIWVSPWRERFEAAADHMPFQAAQNELANSEYLDPILQFCQWFGLDTDRALAMVYDRAVQMGVGGGKKWVATAVGPVSTDALRQSALKALGKKDLEEFQKSVAGLKADGDWGPMTHAAMVSALRALGTKSPIPIPTRDQMLDSMVRAAGGEKWEHRVKGLRNSGEFSDTNFPF